MQGTTDSCGKPQSISPGAEYLAGSAVVRSISPMGRRERTAEAPSSGNPECRPHSKRVRRLVVMTRHCRGPRRNSKEGRSRTIGAPWHLESQFASARHLLTRARRSEKPSTCKEPTTRGWTRGGNGKFPGRRSVVWYFPCSFISWRHRGPAGTSHLPF